MTERDPPFDSSAQGAATRKSRSVAVVVKTAELQRAAAFAVVQRCLERSIRRASHRVVGPIGVIPNGSLALNPISTIVRS